MTLEDIRQLLGWSALLNILILLFWFTMFTYCHGWIYRLHSRWFSLSKTQFDAIHYGGMGLLKLTNLVFFITPYLVLRFYL